MWYYFMHQISKKFTKHPQWVSLFHYKLGYNICVKEWPEVLTCSRASWNASKSFIQSTAKLCSTISVLFSTTMNGSFILYRILRERKGEDLVNLSTLNRRKVMGLAGQTRGRQSSWLLQYIGQDSHHELLSWTRCMLQSVLTTTSLINTTYDHMPQDFTWA